MITIQSPAESVNAFGERVITWSDLMTIHAAVEPIRGREFFAAEQVQSEVSHRVVMRYQTGMTTRMRILHLGRVLQINAIIDVDERHKELQLMCREMADA